MGNITIKPISQIVTKWQNRAGGAGADYTTGVQNPRRPQAATADCGPADVGHRRSASHDQRHLC